MHTYSNITIAILLSTYNGQKYIEELLESIQHQTFKSWKLLIRDDGSTDKTVDIIKAFTNIDLRIHIITDTKGNVGVVRSFSLLAEFALEQLHADYVMYSDQDDIWHSDKIDVTLSKMFQLDLHYPDNTPIAVHTDLRVVNQIGDEVYPSFMELQRLRNEDKDPLGVLLIQNYVTGCTLMVNRALLKLALPFPTNVMMHDWWIALCASIFGQIGFVNKATIDYRQHDNNTIGAKSLKNTILNRLRMSHSERTAIEKESWVSLMAQANELIDIIDKIGLVSNDKSRLELFTNIPNINPISRINTLLHLHIRRQNPFLNIILYLRLPFLRFN